MKSSNTNDHIVVQKRKIVVSNPPRYGKKMNMRRSFDDDDIMTMNPSTTTLQARARSIVPKPEFEGSSNDV